MFKQLVRVEMDGEDLTDSAFVCLRSVLCFSIDLFVAD
jgi:hypothetical protein